MSDRQSPIVSSSNSAGSVLLPHSQWQQNQHPPQSNSVSTFGAFGLQETMGQMPLNQQEGVVHPYPKRLGEPDCPYYMRTGLCGFGVNCKFNHPPNSKLVSNTWISGQFPERPGQKECHYYIKTGTCKFGLSCKYHHPKEKFAAKGEAQLNILGLPLRPGERDCAFYLRTGNCKYGATCKFNHPLPLMPIAGSFVFPRAPVHVPQLYPGGAPFSPPPRPSFLQSPFLAGPSNPPPPILVPPARASTAAWSTYQVSFPVQEGQQGLSYTHPVLVSSQEHVPVGLIQPSVLGSRSLMLDSLQPSTSGHFEEEYPQRPGQQDCSYYMKTGACKYGWQCKFHHPRDRNTSSSSLSYPIPVGLPVRPGASPCAFFSRFGFCKYGSACKFDHSTMQTAYSHFLPSTTTAQITADNIASTSFTEVS